MTNSTDEYKSYWDGKAWLFGPPETIDALEQARAEVERLKGEAEKHRLGAIHGYMCWEGAEDVLAKVRERLASLAPLTDALEGITARHGKAYVSAHLTLEDLLGCLPDLLAGIAELQALVGEQTRTEEMKEQPQEEETPDRGCKHCGRPIYHDHEWLHKTGGESKDHRAEPNWTDWKGGGRYEQNR